VYVLHAFQKKSKRGIAMSKADLDLIDRRLKRAKEDYEQWLSEKQTPGSGNCSRICGSPIPKNG
jgi:hypothetical protein